MSEPTPSLTPEEYQARCQALSAALACLGHCDPKVLLRAAEDISMWLGAPVYHSVGSGTAFSTRPTTLSD